MKIDQRKVLKKSYLGRYIMYHTYRFKSQRGVHAEQLFVRFILSEFTTSSTKSNKEKNQQTMTSGIDYDLQRSNEIIMI